VSRTSLREKVIEEVNLLPEEQLSDVLSIIHRFRLGLEARPASTGIMAFAGVWRDMPDDAFDELLLELRTRRHLEDWTRC
jgi:hypothetical protein